MQENGAQRPPFYYFLHYILIKTLTNIWRMGYNLSRTVASVPHPPTPHQINQPFKRLASLTI